MRTANLSFLAKIVLPIVRLSSRRSPLWSAFWRVINRQRNTFRSFVLGIWKNQTGLPVADRYFLSPTRGEMCIELSNHHGDVRNSKQFQNYKFKSSKPRFSFLSGNIRICFGFRYLNFESIVVLQRCLFFVVAMLLKWFDDLYPLWYIEHE